jgi:hypothetical protein
MSDTRDADKFQKASTEAVEAARVVLSHGDLDVRLARLEKSLQEVPERGH